MPAPTEATRKSGLPMQLPVLDGVRGLAILLVFVCHFAEWYSHSKLETALHLVYLSGWIGVDLFFVLSGFLITRILLRAKGGPRYFVNFYGRRVLRIFPLYYATLLLLLVVAPALSERWAEAVSSRAHPAFWLYAQNLVTYKEVAGLGHLWSLAVEEQFYLVWPFLIWLLPRRALVGVCFASFPVAIALRAHMLSAGVYFGFVHCFTPARIDTLLLGALLAMVVEAGGFTPLFARRARIGFVVSAVALLVIARHDTSLFNYGVWTQGFGYEVIAVFWACFLVTAIAAPGHSLLSRFFCSYPMRTIGKYSYGMYVLHVPLRDFIFRPLEIRERLEAALGEVIGNLVYLVFATAFCLAPAVASYELFEVRFLKLKRFFEYTPRAALAPNVAPGLAAE